MFRHKGGQGLYRTGLEVCHRRRGMNGPGYQFYIRKNGIVKQPVP